MRMVHVHSREDTWRPSMVHSATRHAEGHAGHSTLGAGSVAELKHAFQRMLSGPELDAMDFHTHGSPGSILLGEDRLNVNTLDELRDCGFEGLFKAGAVVEFLGCNVAEEARGEVFLAEFGAIVLRGQGGEVRGSTSVGFQDPLFSGEMAHFWGDWVTAEVLAGGAVRLRNHRHLHPHLIRGGIERLRQLVAERRRRSAGRARESGLGSLRELALIGVESDLDRAERYLDANGGRPSYRFVYHAYDFLSQARTAYGEAAAFVLR